MDEESRQRPAAAEPRIAIIGAGISGLVSLKTCLEMGLSDVRIFEQRDSLGGQWNYQEPDPHTGASTSSIYENVILNSCRDTSCFSDFPIDPARYPDYFGHRQFLNYIHEYVTRFDLKSYIKFNTSVISCRQEEADQKKKKWIVQYQGNDDNESVEEVYDAVFACSGTNSHPLIPSFEGMESFQGQLLHSHVYRNPSIFAGKKVAIIGFGNSAADLSCEIRTVAKEVHLITRRGGWVIPRYVLGKPAEMYTSRFGDTIVPPKVNEWILTRLCNTIMGEPPEEIKPKHSLTEVNFTLRSDLLENIRTGRITAHRASVERITEESIILTNNTTIDDIDVIICCTGYTLELPYLRKEYYRHNNPDESPLKSPNALNLYKLVASPRHPNLFCIGYVHLEGPLLPVSETQARWAVAVIRNEIKLPSVAQMEESIKAYEKNLSSTMVSSNRHTNVIHYLPYCDDLLSGVGVNPTFWRLFKPMFTSNPLQAWRVFNAVYFGICSPAQYRLFGERSMPKLATHTLLRLARGEKEMSQGEKEYVVKA
ncbi:hypothetical protein FQN57_004392 [Myotisia sp. PD_48]|nr:hypothetical protein FQN57_004392 [Myotisia sp. PD_48]